ncbi:hypothetical protein AWV80_24765 [Cupriavidus sp. UYMU48A]|nr:hypothetical protein AWV80_24765 [Cupriavidus sp. UYMU48A]
MHVDERGRPCRTASRSCDCGAGHTGRLDAPNALDTGIGHALDALLAQQNADGHWVYELEADATIPAEYVLMVHYLARRRT